MGYYTGTESTFANLALALKNACSTPIGVDPAAGWTLTGDILSKGTAFVKMLALEAATNMPPEDMSATSYLHGIGLTIWGGTGISGSNLVNPSSIRPRAGPPHKDKLLPVPPYSYEIYTFTDPDEVYMLINWGGAYYYWLAFGVSSVPGVSPTGTGLWLSGTAGFITTSMYNTLSYGIDIDSRGGGDPYTASYANPCTTCAPFWASGLSYGGSGYAGHAVYTPGTLNSTMHLNLEGLSWYGHHSTSDYTYLNYVGAINAVSYAYPHIERNTQPNGEAVLTPIQVYASRAANMSTLCANFKNARYVRLASYSPGDIITLGTDHWKVYPFFRKNALAPNGGTGTTATDHTGTFGWAIRHPGV